MENNEVVYLYLDDIIPNRFQPREVFDDQALKELAISIKEHGVIQPIIVRKVENKYEIIAGERRYKASTMAGLTKIPAIVKNLDDQESSKVALIENLQRRDLTPIEEARTYQKILELEPGMTQEQLAQTMGKTQSVVSNKLRLLALPDEIQDALLKEKISERHARSLLNLVNKNDQIKMLDKVIEERMTVRELDKEIKEMNDNQGQNTDNNGSSITQQLAAINSGFNNLSANNDSTMVDNNMNSTNQEKPVMNMFNPTEVDINKIRENAVDINGPKVPTVDVKDLMRDTTAPVNNDFKFVPSFGANNNVTPAMNSNNSNSSSLLNNSFGVAQSSSNLNDIFQVSTSNPQNSSLGDSSNSSINKFFGGVSDNLQGNSQFNNNIANSITAPSFNLNSFTSTNKKDVTPAINDIKATVKDIETRGFKALIDENDSDNYYQITIKVDKNL